jgi:calcineurin-like phosphoesterase family protein
MYFSTPSFQPTGQIYTDQTGRFPVTSSRGNKYIRLLYDYCSNSITTEPMKSRSEAKMIRVYLKLHDHLVQCSLKPQLQKLDNKAHAGLKNS